METPDDRRQFKRLDKPLTIDFGFIGESASIAGRNSFSGFVEDISLGGIRLLLREKYGKLYNMSLQGKRIKLSLPLSQFEHTIYTTGIIQWAKNTRERTDQLITLGVKFLDLGATDCHYLENYLSTSQGDHNLLWDLWKKEVKP
ncbi:MAG: PilZ domain-containing protein [Deltaproteobacteria bacterium]|nr:PilZ domain-containing protein [Candidatus Anaeroferrophillus wilburensis]MBN2888473.1 PilZ domain-containing protein [Deltaproteobacteria bacterium]